MYLKHVPQNTLQDHASAPMHFPCIQTGRRIHPLASLADADWRGYSWTL